MRHGSAPIRWHLWRIWSLTITCRLNQPPIGPASQLRIKIYHKKIKKYVLVYHDGTQRNARKMHSCEPGPSRGLTWSNHTFHLSCVGKGLDSLFKRSFSNKTKTLVNATGRFAFLIGIPCTSMNWEEALHTYVSIGSETCQPATRTLFS